MFPHISAFLAVAIAVVASARMERHIRVRNSSAESSIPYCNTGSLSCCDGLFNATDMVPTLGNLNIPFDEADKVGINCTPLNIDGAGQAAACQQQPVCCSGNTYEGFINIGCSPLDVL